jgi:hypothetical protein
MAANESLGADAKIVEEQRVFGLDCVLLPIPSD